MDDSNLMQNTTSISPDKKDNMTSVSPPKRTIVLGVVNTTGMKSTNINRKRRWDQPPEDISGPPTVKKMCISENEAFPVNETESLEAASAVSPNVDRVNSQCDNIGLSNQSTHGTFVENEEISIELSRPLSSDISNEASAMSIDLPEEKSDSCEPPLCEPSSDTKSCSGEPNENLSEVNILESCDRLQCVETVNSPINDSRFIVGDVKSNRETASVTVNESKIVKHELKSNVSTTVISHQSEELRRIMFSYDEGSSDSDTMESSKEDNANESISSNKIDDNAISIHPSTVSPSDSNIQLTGLESSDDACESTSFKDTVISENDISHVSPVEKSLGIQTEYNSNETDAFIETSKSVESLGENEGSLIESQLNIPKKSEVIENTMDKEIECDFLENKNQENIKVVATHCSSSIHGAVSIETLSPKDTSFQNSNQLDSDNQNSSKETVINEISLENIPTCEDINRVQHVELAGESISTNDDVKGKIRWDEKSEVDNSSNENSNFDYTVDKTENSLNIKADVTQFSSSIHGSDSIETLSTKETSFQNSNQSGSDNQNSSKDTVINEISLENIPTCEDINRVQHVELAGEAISKNDDLKSKIKWDEKSEVDNSYKENSNFDYTVDKMENSHDDQEKYLMNDVSLKINNLEAVVQTSEKIAQCDENALNVIENDISIDHYTGTDVEIIEGYNTESGVIGKNDSEQPSDKSISMDVITNEDEKIEISVIEKTESTISIMEVTDTNSKSIEISELDSDTSKVREIECHNKHVMEDNTVISSVDADQTELRSTENNNALNVIENDISIDHYPGTDVEIIESYNTESEVIGKYDSGQPSDKSISMGMITNEDEKIKISVIEKTEPTISTVEVTDTNSKSIEINESDSDTGNVREIECHNKHAMQDNTVISSEDADQTELASTENNEIEISTEETIETEISIEENVESELCPLENDEIVSFEANIDKENDDGNIINSGGNINSQSTSDEKAMTVENFDIEIPVTETNEVSTVEEVDSNTIEEMPETECEPQNIFQKPIETISNVGDISPSRIAIDQELKVLEDVSGSSEIKNVPDTTQEILKELVIQEEITMDEDSTIEECVIEDSNLAIREEDVLTAVDSPSFGDVLNPSPEESKIFEESIDVSETIGDEGGISETISEEGGIDNNVVIEPVVEETKTIDHEMDSSKVVTPVEISPELSFVEESILQDDSKTLTEDIEESFVVEEVVTCESLESNKDADNELGSVNEDVSSPLIVFEETCETTEPFVNNELNAVIKENTVDSDVSAIDNQNELSDDSNLDFKKYDDSNIEKSVKKHISISNDLISEPSMNNIRSDSPLLDMECESSVNSIIKTDSDVEMDIVEPTGIEKSSIGLKIDKMKVDRSSPPVLNIGSELTSVVKDVGNNVPLLTTVNNSTVLMQDKPTSSSIVDINRSESISAIDPKLEPITLRIYKDNLSIRTDDLDSPKKSRSPKLSSELKSQLSPHIKSSDSRSSLSPTTKKLEFTLKIAKDVNTNIPRATMSPKNSVSPGGIHKPGDILRAELTAEGGRNSPAYTSPESGTNKVLLKIQKPGLSKDYTSHIPGDIKEETAVKDDVDHASEISLPKPSIEIGNVFKKMMETEKNVDSKPEISMDHSLNSSLLATPISIPVVRKRGRPRKILQKVITGSDPSLNSSLMAGHSPGLPFNHTPGASGLDVSSGVDSSDQSSRQVRSCRARTKPIVVKTRKPRGGGARGGMRGRGAISSGVGGIVRNLAAEMDPEKLAAKLSEREKAELAKIEERKERQRQERHAKNEAKKAKKLARKLKDEERRLKKLREKAEKAEAAAPQVFEEETRMSAPDGGSRGHTPAPASALSRLNQTGEHNEESQNSISTPTSSQIKRGRMEIPIDPECKEVRVEHLAEYQWQGSELFMIQEQVSLYLGVKSFKRKYPDLKRRPVEAEERTFLEDSGLVPKSMCDLGLTAVSSAEILDIMYQDFPDKYEEFRKYVREKQAREASFKQKAVFASLKQDKSKGEPREQALEAVAMWNSNLNRERREERRCALDLQTFTVHYPKQLRDRMSRPVPKTGLYPVSLIPGQFSDSFKVYTPTELMYFPLNTVMYGPLKPNERQPINPSDGSGSDSSSSSTSDDSSSSSSECESEDENGGPRECKICNGEKKTNKESHPEILLQCSNCKGLCHPTCQEITPEMLPHIKKYTWHCSNCKKCMICKNNTRDDKMLFCDLCDRGYHIVCVGLKKAPEGRWHCSVCSFCTVCGSKDPGGPEWNYEYKKTDKGVRLYQRTLCVPCSKNALM